MRLSRVLFEERLGNLGVLVLSYSANRKRGDTNGTVGRTTRRGKRSIAVVSVFLLSNGKASRTMSKTCVNVMGRVPFFFKLLCEINVLVSDSGHGSPICFTGTLLYGGLSTCVRSGSFSTIIAPRLCPTRALDYVGQGGLLRVPTITIKASCAYVPF